MDDLLADAMRETVPDMAEDQVTQLVEHLTSPEIGVKSMERLYDVDLADMRGIVSKCDATLLFRTWQSKYSKCHPFSYKIESSLHRAQGCSRQIEIQMKLQPVFA